jgi:zinc protease
MVEVSKELNEILNTRPHTEEELLKTQKNRVLRMPGSWETLGAVGGSINQIVQYGLPDNYYDTYPQKIKNLKLQNVSDAAKEILKPDKLIWVVVGDRAKIETGIKELGYGEIQAIDADGNIVQ